MEVVASLCQCRTAAAQCGLFTHKSVPFIFEPPCIKQSGLPQNVIEVRLMHGVNSILFALNKRRDMD